MAKVSFAQKHKFKLIGLVVFFIVLVLSAFAFYYFSPEDTPSGASLDQKGPDVLPHSDEDKQKGTETKPNDPDKQKLAGVNTVTGIGGILEPDEPSSSQTVNKVAPVKVEPPAGSIKLTHVAQNYAHIDKTKVDQVRGKVICADNKSYKVTAVNSRNDHDLIYITPYWTKSHSELYIMPGDCPGNPWKAPVAKGATPNTNHMTVMAVHPHPQQHGYGGNNVGIIAADIDRVKIGNKVCIKSKTFIVESITNSPSRDMKFIRLIDPNTRKEAHLNAYNAKIMVDETVKLGEC